LSVSASDFAGLSLANVHHRRNICVSIESAIAAHEPVCAKFAWNWNCIARQ
jgi:predicted component of type VI protein secretion system